MSGRGESRDWTSAPAPHKPHCAVRGTEGATRGQTLQEDFLYNAAMERGDIYIVGALIYFIYFLVFTCSHWEGAILQAQEVGRLTRSCEIHVFLATEEMGK